MTIFPLAADLDVNLAALIDTRLLVQANSGGGKSWCLRRILEQTHGRVQHLVIDPEGEFASLRERFDYVLAARQGADTAADPRSAKLLAERLLELGASAILDIYELKAHERIRFVRGFLEALVDAPKALWHPALVVVDEAHVYCPQQGEAESAGAVIDLATRGRKRGFCAILATQRLSKLHKDAAAECNNKLIGRTGLDVDMKRAGDELGFTKDRLRELRELTAGHFFAFGPAISRAVVRVQVGGVQTTHPKTGGRLAFTPPPPTDKVRALLPKLADLPAEAEARQRTLEDLQRELAAARRELTIAKKAAPAPTVERVEKPVLTPDQERRLADLEEIIARWAHGAEEQVRYAEQNLAAIRQTVDAFRLLRAAVLELIGARQAPAGRPIPAFPPQPVSRPGHQVAQTAARRRLGGQGDQGSGIKAQGSQRLGKGERKVLTAVAQYPDGASREQLTILTGYKRSSRDTYLQRLTQAGLVAIINSGDLVATDAGVAALGADFEPLPTGAALRAYWLDRLTGGERAILQAVLEQYPQAVTREALSDETDYKRSSRDTYIQRLVQRRLVGVDGRGTVRASDVLFD